MDLRVITIMAIQALATLRLCAKKIELDTAEVIFIFTSYLNRACCISDKKGLC